MGRASVCSASVLGAVAALALSAPAEASVKSQLRAAIQKRQPALDRCYDRELKRDHPASGTVVIEMVVGRSGKVSSAKVARASRSQAQVSKCLAQKLKHMKLPRQTGRAVVQVPIRLQTG